MVRRGGSCCPSKMPTRPDAGRPQPPNQAQDLCEQSERQNYYNTSPALAPGPDGAAGVVGAE
jgi:hypothetical protein